MVNFDFRGKVAVVTGAGEGIGYEVARQLCANGASVLLNDIDAPLAKKAAAAIHSSTGGACEAFPGDMSLIAEVRALVAAAVKRFGRLDYAIANAGLTAWGDFFDFDPAAFERVTSLNLRGSFFLAQAAARHMRERGGGGRIIFMSSVTGHQAIRYLSAYGMTKAGLEMLARNLVIELSPHRITINTIAPGATITPRNLEDDPNYASVWGRVIPIGHAAQPVEIAQPLLFLLTDEAEHITGQSIVVDGGWTAISPTPSLDFVNEDAGVE